MGIGKRSFFLGKHLFQALLLVSGGDILALDEDDTGSGWYYSIMSFSVIMLPENKKKDQKPWRKQSNCYTLEKK